MSLSRHVLSPADKFPVNIFVYLSTLVLDYKVENCLTYKQWYVKAVHYIYSGLIYPYYKIGDKRNPVFETARRGVLFL